MRHFLTDEIYVKLVSKRKATLAVFLKELFYAGKDGEVVSFKEVQAVTHFPAKKIYRMLGESIFSQVLTPNNNSLILGGQKMGKNRGRPEKYVKVPTLRELEKHLGCVEKRRSEIGFETEKELKAKVAAVGVYHSKAKSGAEFGLYGKVKYGNFSNAYLINKSGMSKNTWKKYSKISMRSDPVFEEKAISVQYVASLPETVKDHRSYIVANGKPFPNNKSGAVNAIRQAHCIEKVSVVTQLSSRRILIADMEEPELIAIDCYRQYGGAISIDKYISLHPNLHPGYQPEHREHYNLSQAMKEADEHRQSIESQEEQRILRKAAFGRM